MDSVHEVNSQVVSTHTITETSPIDIPATPSHNSVRDVIMSQNNQPTNLRPQHQQQQSQLFGVHRHYEYNYSHSMVINNQPIQQVSGGS